MDKKLATAVAMLFCLTATAATAHGYKTKKARVVAVQPIYQTIVVDRPVSACYQDYVERPVANRSVAGQTLAGAIVGAAIGRQFGDGSGRDALTVLGAVAGSAVANDRALRRQAARGDVTIVREPIERCTTEYRPQRERRVAGYWVDYRYRGRIHRVRSDVYPGDHIYVAVGP